MQHTEPTLWVLGLQQPSERVPRWEQKLPVLPLPLKVRKQVRPLKRPGVVDTLSCFGLSVG